MLSEGCHWGWPNKYFNKVPSLIYWESTNLLETVKLIYEIIPVACPDFVELVAWPGELGMSGAFLFMISIIYGFMTIPHKLTIQIFDKITVNFCILDSKTNYLGIIAYENIPGLGRRDQIYRCNTLVPNEEHS